MFLGELTLQGDGNEDKNDHPAGVQVDWYPENFADQQAGSRGHFR